MKTIISIIVGILGAIGVFYLDSLLINWILRQFPGSVSEWLGIIKIILWILAFAWTVGIAIVIGVFAGAITRFILDGDMD
jgi:hypothetical protein